jgi:small-conductance mechanosensitive channel
MDIQNKPKHLKSKGKKGELVSNRVWIVSYMLLAAIAITVYFLLRLHVFNIFGTYLQSLQKIALGTFIAILILALAKFIEDLVTKRTHAVYTRYNLRKMIHLVSWMLIAAVTVSFLFRNWYSAAVSLGLISLILGFALQNPISSFIGWLYILIRQPYHVGDRIQIDTFKGDVVEVNYLDTTLWEFSGEYISNDLPSGRLIRFPNSLVLQAAVFNYSWEKFPYIWNEISFHVAYESDLKYVGETTRQIANEELGPATVENIERYKALVEQTPVDKLEIKEYPYVSFRIHPNTWVEVTVTYLVEPKKAAGVRSVLVQKILAELLTQREKVLFPNSNAR